ncbi:hypothetical protein AYO44_18120, partial [Planctomycetaceae bacterium SCGC AG-212-F19]
MYRVIPLLLLATGLVMGQAPKPITQTDDGKKAIGRIQQLGGQVMELAQNDNRLEVSYLYADGKITDEHLALLKALKGLVHLNLRGQPITDEHLAHLKGLTELTRLHLEKTKVTDKGMEQLKGLVNLEYLNLYNTEVTDAGLAQLEGLKKLKNVYLWQTKVTDAGAAKFKQAIPGADVNRGIEDKPKEAKPEEKKDDKKPADKKDEKKPEEKK